MTGKWEMRNEDMKNWGKLGLLPVCCPILTKWCRDKFAGVNDALVATYRRMIRNQWQKEGSVHLFYRQMWQHHIYNQERSSNEILELSGSEGKYSGSTGNGILVEDLIDVYKGVIQSTSKVCTFMLLGDNVFISVTALLFILLRWSPH